MEAAGLALAIFPLVIQGISNLVEAVSTIKKFKHYHRELKRDARTIENEWTGFQLSMDNLLSYIGHEYEDAQTLLKNPGGAAWKEPKFQKKLKAYLDDSFYPFIQTIDDLLEDLEELCEKLDINSDTREIKPVDFFRDSINRFKHTFGQSVYKEIFERIRKANDFLRRTTFQSQASYTWRVQGQTRLKGQGISRLRQQAVNLHKNLAQRDRWSCPCRDRHLLSLCLDKLDSGLTLSKAEAIVFEMAIGSGTLDTLGEPFPNLDEWRMLEVQCEEILSAIDEDDTSVLSTAPIPLTKVKFKFNDNLKQSGAEKNYQQTVISDLCAAIYACTPEFGYLGHLEKENTTKHQHCLFRAPWPWPRGKALEPVDLLLAKLSTANHAQQGASIFSRRSRLMVAAQLALGVLILDGSWLREDWSSRDIMLIRGALQSKSLTGTVNVQDALLLPYSLGNSATDLIPIRSGSGEVRCAALFALGITLIELSLGARLEDLKEAGDDNPDQIVSKRKTAFRLLPRVEEQDGDTYANVVERCLDCPFDVARRDLSFDNAKFRELVYESIVKPLKDNAAVFTRN